MSHYLDMAAPMERVVSPSQGAESLVDELYEFRDHYIERFGLEKAGDKAKDVEQKMKECCSQLEVVKGDIKNKAKFHYFLGRALNVTPKYSAEAEEALSKAVKLDPKLVEAWNHLGECYWKKEDISAAKNCFTGALNHSKNKVSLRNLSMVMRQLSGPPAEKVKLIEESIARAKEAIELDIKDGTSWLILGNAYLCQFFLSGQVPTILKQSMQAYGQAEKDLIAHGNPDLHYNRATAYQYQEEYQKALEGYSTAAQLDPGWPEPKTKESGLMSFLTNIQEMIVCKGRTKPRKLESMIAKALNERNMGNLASGHYVNISGKTVDIVLCPLADLKPKVNEGKFAQGVVVCHIPLNNPVPFTFCMVDKAQCCIAVTVYNMAEGVGVKIGDCVAISEPFTRKVALTHKGKELNFSSIQVMTPRHLIVNGRPMSANKVAPTLLSVSTLYG